MIMLYDFIVVSIHAPVWGATLAVVMLLLALQFQSTHPCGVRLLASLIVSVSFCFNPRTRVGCDLFDWSTWCYNLVSIHAPVWGATPMAICLVWVKLFQSTHPCGVRLTRVDLALDDFVSIHAPVWGATFKQKYNLWYLSFNPRTRVGCDVCVIIAIRDALFQSTHPCGVRLPF